ncbi:MAG: hypothetical protein NVS4B1_14510 [Ktedonobacteraceae bacterium]
MQTPGIAPRPRVRLTKERFIHKWSQRELADLIGTSTVNISRWERGLTRPGPYFREKLCVLFSKSEQELDLEASTDWVAAKISELPDIQHAPLIENVNSVDQAIPEKAAQEDTASAGNKLLYDPLIPRRSALELVGRHEELTQLRKRLCSGQSVALTALNGLPGVGKTALSIALVQDEAIRAYFRDGILWAGLGPEPNISSMLSRWGKLLEVPDIEMAELASNEARARAIRTVLGTRRMLVVIDDAWFIEQALLFKVGGPDCVHLVTTRFPALASHFAPDGAIGIRELGTEDSMKLLSTLAPDVVQEEAQKAQDLISAVGGLPLALTLIGNYLRKQSHSRQRRRIKAALEHLSHAEERLHLSEPQEAAEAHSSLTSDMHLSLQSVFSVTDRQLNAQTRHALYALSVFPAKPNTFSEKAALAVAHCDVETLDMLSDAGLLESSDNERYTLHQTIADYARVQLKDVSAYERFVNYITTSVEMHEKEYDLLERESHLVFATLDLAYTTGKQDYLIRAVLAFTPYLLSRGLYTVAKPHLQRAYAAAQQREHTPHITRALLYLGRIAQKQGDYAQAEDHFQDGLTLAREKGDREAICSLLTELGSMTWKRGDYEKAEAYLQEGLSLANEIGQSWYICVILDMLGSIATRKGNYAQSEQYLQEGLAIARQIEDREQTCIILSDLGVTVGEQGRHAQAEVYLKEGLALARQIGHREWMCGLLSNLGSASVEQERFAQAETYFKEGIVLARQFGQREWASLLLINLGLTTRRLKNYQQAKDYLQESLEVARQLGIPQITANSLYEYGNLYLDLQHFDMAEKSFYEMLSIAPEGSQDLIALAQYGLAQALVAQGRNDDARRLGEESVATLTAIGHRNITEVRDWLIAFVQ